MWQTPIHISMSKQEATHWVKCNDWIMVVWICLSCTISKVSAEQFRLSSCCKALHANKLISAVLQALMFFCFLTLPRKEICSHANGGNRTHLPHLEKPTTNLTKSVGKSTDFGKIRHRLWENQPSTLVKWATDYGKMSHWLWENEPPTTGKWATDFGKMNHRFWEKMSHWCWWNERRRRLEIRNIFSKISSNKIT